MSRKKPRDIEESPDACRKVARIASRYPYAGFRAVLVINTEASVILM